MMVRENVGTAACVISKSNAAESKTEKEHLEKRFIRKMMGEQFEEFWEIYEKLFSEQRKRMRELIYQLAGIDGSKIEAAIEAYK